MFQALSCEGSRHRALNCSLIRPTVIMPALLSERIGSARRPAMSVSTIAAGASLNGFPSPLAVQVKPDSRFQEG